MTYYFYFGASVELVHQNSGVNDIKPLQRIIEEESEQTKKSSQNNKIPLDTSSQNIYTFDGQEGLLDIPILYPGYDWNPVAGGEIILKEDVLYSVDGTLSLKGQEWVAKYGTDKLPEVGFYRTDNNFEIYYRTELVEKRKWVDEINLEDIDIGVFQEDGPLGSSNGYIYQSENNIRVIQYENKLNEYRVFVSEVVSLDDLLLRIKEINNSESLGNEASK